MPIEAKTVSQQLKKTHRFKKYKDLFPYLFPALFFLLHLCLQFPHHHLPLPLRNGSALFVMSGHQGLYIHTSGLAGLTRGTVAVHHNRYVITGRWCAQVLEKIATSRRNSGCGWGGGSRWRVCRLDRIGLRGFRLRLGLRLGFRRGFGLSWRSWTFSLKKKIWDVTKFYYNSVEIILMILNCMRKKLFYSIYLCTHTKLIKQWRYC